MWELRYQRDKFSIEAGRAKGRSDPEWLADCPEILAGEFPYLQAFWDLSTERNSQGETHGRIPWSKARQYAIEEFSLPPDMLRPFWIVIRKLDSTFLTWETEQHRRTLNALRPAKGSKPKTMGARSTSRRSKR